MTPYLELLRLVRHPARIRSEELIGKLFSDFVAYESPDSALIAGRASLDGHPITVLAQQKPKSRTVAEAAAVNYGMMRGAGYWFVLERLAAAAARGESVLTLIDTPGADPSGPKGERVAWAISASISAFLAHPGPTVSVVIGEGGSGGALALQVTDRRLMVSDAMYSVISPESCSAILFRDSDDLDRAMGVLQPSAEQARRVGMVDRIVDWSHGLALTEQTRAAEVLRTAVIEALREARDIQTSDRRRLRYRALLDCGRRNLEAGHAPLEGPGGRPAQAPKASAEKQSIAEPPASTPKAEPVMRKLVRIGAESDTIALLQHAYFAPATEQTEGGPWVLCPKARGGCGAVSAEAAYRRAGWSCPTCGIGERLSAMQWAGLLCDPGSFEELHPTLDLEALHGAGYETDTYRQQRRLAREQTGCFESLRVGLARIEGHACAIALSEFGFYGGTLGAVAGEKIRLLCEEAVARRWPLVTVTSSGGARMQEGLLALAQMAKANAAIMRLLESGHPHISVLADPCTGGALASYATFATVILAEPRALVSFAGPRVMRAAGLAVDDRNLSSETALAVGGVDEVVSRTRLRSRISRYIEVDQKSTVRRMRERKSHAPDSTTEIEQWPDAVLARLSEMVGDEPSPSSGRPSQQSHRALADLSRRLGKMALGEIPALLRRLSTNDDGRVRANAVEALSAFGSTSRSVLSGFLDDPHHRVRANAAMQLLIRNPSDQAALLTLTRLSQAEAAVERRAALYVIACGRLPLLRDIAWMLASDPDLGVRVAAATTLLAFDGESARAPLEELLSSGGPGAVAHVESFRRFLPETLGQVVSALLRASVVRRADLEQQ